MCFVNLPTGWWSISRLSLSNFNHLYCNIYFCWSQWPRSVRRRSAATRQLRLWVRVLPKAWMFVSCECCVLLGRGLCDELITHPGDSYRLWCIIACDLETSKMRRLWPTLSNSATKKKKYVFMKIRGKETFDGGTRDAFLEQPWKLIFHIWRAFIKDKMHHHCLWWCIFLLLYIL